MIDPGQMDSREAGRLGREAVALGFPFYEGLTVTDFDHYSDRVVGGSRNPWDWDWDYPDFGDHLTALACIPWFASHYPDHDITIDYNRDGTVSVTAAQDGTGGNSMDAWHDFNGPTLAHACLAAVRAARGTE